MNYYLNEWSSTFSLNAVFHATIIVDYTSGRKWWVGEIFETLLDRRKRISFPHISTSVHSYSVVLSLIYSKSFRLIRSTENEDFDIFCLPLWCFIQLLYVKHKRTSSCFFFSTQVNKNGLFCSQTWLSFCFRWLGIKHTSHTYCFYSSLCLFLFYLTKLYLPVLSWVCNSDSNVTKNICTLEKGALLSAWLPWLVRLGTRLGFGFHVLQYSNM